ncbi:VanZ family protein [uncultured Lacticaseibacillus sp.]|uniref:VanZ family protein n=1 Tax=uncultured Lacticaseibacillus sp. TaxID=2775882 RepID=UPI002592E04D|nr:VanZ family protein [uncultured Lacticaseibacillus sp.]
MASYLGPIKTAVFIFPFLAALLSLPFAVLQYRRYGSVLWSRTIVLFSFVFYMLCAYFLIILPLPSIHAVAALQTPRYNIVPFTFVREFVKYSGFELGNYHTWIQTLKQPSFLQPAFNLMLTVPFGFYMRYYFRRPWWQAVLLTFGLSLFYELTQLSGLYFIYPRPYRLFDVDDLFINTTGGLIGFWLTPLIAVAFPSRAKMDERSYARADRVGPLRRLVAWVIDYVIIAGLFGVLISIVLQLTVFKSLADNWFITSLLPMVCVLYLVPLGLHGQTWGKKLLRIRIVAVDGQPLTWWRLALRQGLLYVVTLPLFGVWFDELNNVLVHIGARTQLNLLALGLLSAFVLFVVWNFFWQIVRRRERLFYEAWSGTEQVAIRPDAKVEGTPKPSNTEPTGQTVDKLDNPDDKQTAK